MGLDAHSVSNPAQAMEWIEQADSHDAPFDAAVIDAMMPEIDGFTLARHLRERNGARPTLVMMLPPVDRQSGLDQCRELDIHAYFSKPFKIADVAKALSSSASLTEIQLDMPDTGGLATSAAVPVRSLNLLLVDDNPFNQKVGSYKLERLGHRVRVAASGQEALTILENASFDLIFMDMQMPEMDGLETTARIRGNEGRTGLATPIVAMTANAGEDAREKCLGGGMNAYIAKPINDRELAAVIAKLVPASVEPSQASFDDQPVTPAAPVTNRDALLARVGGNLAMLRELISMFRQDSAPIMELLKQALQANNGKEVHHQAHTLKGMINFFNVPAVSGLAFELEKLGNNGDCRNGLDTYSRLRRNLDLMYGELSAI